MIITKEGAMIQGEWSTKQVFFAGVELQPVCEIPLCPTYSFSWGSASRRAGALALRILLLYLDEDRALLFCEAFKREFIALLPQQDFSVDESAVVEWIANKQSRGHTS